MSKGLTVRQRKIMNFIVHTVKLYGRQPSYREIGKHFGIKSPRGISDHILALQRKGFLGKEKHKARGLVFKKTLIPFEAEKTTPALFEQKLKTVKPILDDFMEQKLPECKVDVQLGLGIIITKMFSKLHNIKKDELGYERLSVLFEFCSKYISLNNVAMRTPGINRINRNNMMGLAKDIEEAARIHSHLMNQLNSLESKSIKVYADMSNTSVNDAGRYLQAAAAGIQSGATSNNSNEPNSEKTEAWLERWRHREED